MKWTKQMIRRYQELVVYVVFGIATTIVNIVVFYLLDTALSIPYLIANAVAIVVSILFAFYTNKKYVFQSKATTLKAIWSEFISFVTFRIVSGVFDMLSMWVLVDALLMGTNTAKIITQFIVVVLNYLFSKFFVFKQKEV